MTRTDMIYRYNYLVKNLYTLLEQAETWDKKYAIYDEIDDLKDKINSSYEE